MFSRRQDIEDPLKSLWSCHLAIDQFVKQKSKIPWRTADRNIQNERRKDKAAVLSSLSLG